jgi:hypothetical protein
MLHELEVLEARRIADLALDARKVRDRLLEKVRAADLGEPTPARGEHNPAGELVLNGLLANQPAVVALSNAIAELPRDIRLQLWVVMQVGHGDIGILDWDDAMAAALQLTDDDIVADMVGEADLHEWLRKGLYVVGAATLPGDAV